VRVGIALKLEKPGRIKPLPGRFDHLANSPVAHNHYITEQTRRILERRLDTLLKNRRVFRAGSTDELRSSNVLR
jgi:hypothetical protein